MAFILANIGSNLGNRRLNLSRAVRMIGEEFGAFEISHVVESDPDGFDSTNSFLNVGISFHSELAPQDLLSRLQRIERAISPASHRDAEGGYIDRVIDIDIIAIDREVIDTESLKVPHPRMAQRDFVLVPLEELAPAWTHPVTGLTPSQMLENLKPERKEECR